MYVDGNLVHATKTGLCDCDGDCDDAVSNPGRPTEQTTPVAVGARSRMRMPGAGRLMRSSADEF